MSNYLVYTDGACSGNPGPGASVSIIINDGEKEILVHSYVLTTNNRMELLAVIHALEHIPDDAVVSIVSDSQYITNAINKGWLSNWIESGLESRANYDLWDRLLKQLSSKTCSFSWCRAHDEESLNNEADRLARTAIKNAKEPDYGYKNYKN